jgi:hypothetical protein
MNVVAQLLRLPWSADEVLRGRGTEVSSPAARLTIALALSCALMYGAAMGCSGDVVCGRPLQILYSAVKLPALLVITFALSLPSFFVVNMLLGLHEDFGRVLRALATAQAALTIVLASLAPLTLLWYVSTANHDANVAFNAAAFAVAAVAAQQVLRREYRPLIAKDVRHGKLLRAWLVVYAFVGIQTAWVLRPFIGDPNRPTQLFRDHAWGNAYEWLARMVWRLIA